MIKIQIFASRVVRLSRNASTSGTESRLEGSSTIWRIQRSFSKKWSMLYNSKSFMITNLSASSGKESQCSTLKTEGWKNKFRTTNSSSRNTKKRTAKGRKKTRGMAQTTDRISRVSSVVIQPLHSSRKWPTTEMDCSLMLWVMHSPISPGTGTRASFGLILIIDQWFRMVRTDPIWQGFKDRKCCCREGQTNCLPLRSKPAEGRTQRCIWTLLLSDLLWQPQMTQQHWDLTAWTSHHQGWTSKGPRSLKRDLLSTTTVETIETIGVYLSLKWTRRTLSGMGSILRKEWELMAILIKNTRKSKMVLVREGPMINSIFETHRSKEERKIIGRETKEWEIDLRKSFWK
jgi:hypothetical protein